MTKIKIIIKIVKRIKKSESFLKKVTKQINSLKDSLRKRKKYLRLEMRKKTITDAEEIRSIIREYYFNLMATYSRS